MSTCIHWLLWYDPMWFLLCDDVWLWYATVVWSESCYCQYEFLFDMDLLSRLESWFRYGSQFWFRCGSRWCFWYEFGCCFQYESLIWFLIWFGLISDMSPWFLIWVLDVAFDMGPDFWYGFLIDLWYGSWFLIWFLDWFAIWFLDSRYGSWMVFLSIWIFYFRYGSLIIDMGFD